MGNYSELKDLINNPTSHGLPEWDNGDNRIEGEMMKSYLLAIVNSLSAGGYLYAGVAHPGDAAVTPDANVFYIASEAGTYTNKGGLVVADGEVAIFKYNGTWSKEVTGAATAAQVTELGQYIENGEWAKVVVDADNKFLYGVKLDGKFYFGAGCPPQVLEELTTKVDKENGKSLIDEDFASAQEVIDNPQFLEATIDKESKLLEGRKADGTKVLYGPIEFDKVFRYQKKNDSYIYALTDNADKIELGIKKDGTVFIPKLESRSIDGIIPIRVNSNNENKNVGDFTTPQGLSWNAVGTSVTQGYTADGQPGSEDITPYLYVAQVASELGLQANNYGMGATTICKNMKSDAVVDFHELNSSIVERVCGLNGRTAYPDADIWTIEGAPNDIYRNSEIGSIYSTKDEIETVYGALKRIIEEIQGRSNNPRLMLIYWAFNKYERDNEQQAYEVEKAFIWAANYYGVPLLNLRRESGLSPYNVYRMSIGDGVHPSANGTNMYKHKIAKFINQNI